MRLHKYIALTGLCSRRKAETLISNNEIRVNGKIITKLGSLIDPEQDHISYQGKILKIPIKKYYLALNKPAGLLTTCSDPQKRQTIFTLIPKKYPVHPVGRLDKDTEGLLFLTNDGDFTYRLTHPKFEKEKEYFVKIHGLLQATEIHQIEKGLQLPVFKTAPAQILQVQTLPQKNLTTLHLILKEGKKRQIREIFKHFNKPVLYLKRVRIGPINLGNLRKGHFRFLAQNEVKNLILNS